VYVAILLSLLHVPAAVPLAVLAGICDVIPVAGIFVATAPAVLLALTVSPTTAGIVLGLYALYHAAETYIIVPRVYGQQLRLSTLAVLLALMVGTALQGLIGAVLVLPLVAAYPIIERIWLRGYLNPEVLKDHRALADFDDTGREQALQEVLQGEEHAGEERRATR
jgi:predicted PurR-regulated permease PerM